MAMAGQASAEGQAEVGQEATAGGWLPAAGGQCNPFQTPIRSFWTQMRPFPNFCQVRFYYRP